jgi:hypothetical protein
MQLSANAIRTQGDVPPLKVLRVQRALGSRRTLYEISPTDTVTLTEVEPVFLSGVVTTGVATVRERQSRTSGALSVAPRRAEPAAAPPPPPVAPPTDSSRAADAVIQSTETAATAKTSTAKPLLPQTLAAGASTERVNTINWIESASGKALSLSGKLSVERLQEIRRRIEKERSARSP